MSTTNMLQNTQFETVSIPSTTFRTIPHINTTNAQPFTNSNNIPQNPSNTPTYNTVPPSRYLTLQFKIQNI